MRRRSFLQAGVAASVVGSLPRFSLAQQLPFDPKPAGWRTFEVTTRVELQFPDGVSRAWVPVPSVEGPYQKVISNTWAGNAVSRIVSDGKYGANMVLAEWSPSEKASWTSRLAIALPCSHRTRLPSTRSPPAIMPFTCRKGWTGNPSPLSRSAVR